jgi:hypothetical protein
VAIVGMGARRLGLGSSLVVVIMRGELQVKAKMGKKGGLGLKIMAIIMSRNRKTKLFLQALNR